MTAHRPVDVGAGPHDRGERATDRGAILPLVLVVSVVLSMVVLGVASYATATLKKGAVVESRADRLAAAEAAMNDALERLRRVDDLCTTSSGAGESVNPSFPDVNGSSADVRCGVFGNELPPSDGWAIVVTGEQPGAGSGNTFITTAGGSPVVEGPVFVHNPSRTAFKDTTIKKGSLWYTDTACAGANTDQPLSFRDSSVAIPNLSFDPNTRKVYCVNRTWQQLFSDVPPVANVPTADAPPPTNHGACKVFYPGRYHSGNQPVLAADNYFVSGNYLFDNLGNISVSHTAMTFGTVAPEDDPIYPLLPLSNACEAVRQADAPEGATLYLRGSSRFTLNAQSHIEVAGRQQGDYIVALHALDNIQNVLSTGSGNNKESAFSGLVWAPYSRVEVGTVAAQKEAAFRGGLVVGAFDGTISAAPSGGFLIRVPTSQASVKLLLEAEAENGDGTTTIRVVADYRPSTGDIAVNSWRVCPTSGC